MVPHPARRRRSGPAAHNISLSKPDFRVRQMPMEIAPRKIEAIRSDGSAMASSWTGLRRWLPGTLYSSGPIATNPPSDIFWLNKYGNLLQHLMVSPPIATQMPDSPIRYSGMAASPPEGTLRTVKSQLMEDKPPINTQISNAIDPTVCISLVICTTDCYYQD